MDRQSNPWARPERENEYCAFPFETKIIWAGLSSCAGIPAFRQRYRAIGAFGPLAQLSKGSTRYDFLETKGHKIGLVRRGWIFARGPRW